MNVQPVRDRIIVQPHEDESVSSGGIVVPVADESQPKKGSAVAVGDGAVTKEGKVIPMVVNKDDVILYPRDAGQRVNIEGVDYVILRENEVLAILSEEG